MVQTEINKRCKGRKIDWHFVEGNDGRLEEAEYICEGGLGDEAKVIV